MQYLLFGFLVVFISHSVLSETFEEVKAACNKITGFDGDIDKLDYSDPAISEKVKCTVACAFEKHDMFKADGSIDKGKQKPLIEESVKDEEMKMKYLKAVEDCDASAKANKCDTAYEFLKCVDTKAEGTSK